MKKLLKYVVCAMALAVAPAAFSQTQDGVKEGVKESQLTPEHKASRFSMQLSEKLTLDANQTAQLKKMAVDYYTQMDEIKSTGAEYEASKQKLESDYTRKFKELLNDDQKKKFDAYIAEKQKK